MSPFRRWMFALAGAALIVIVIIAVFLFAEWLGIQLSIDRCLDRGGRWDYSLTGCVLSE